MKSSPFLALAILLFASTSAADVIPLWETTRFNDAAITLAALPDMTGDGRDEVVIAYDSGAIVCLDGAASTSPTILWSGSMPGSPISLLAIPDVTGDGRHDVVAGDDLGNIHGLDGGPLTGGAMLWQHSVSCGVAALTLMPDINNDGYGEVAAGSANQSVSLLNSQTGAVHWTRLLNPINTNSYVHRILPAGDLNGNSTIDMAVWTWDGVLFAIEGVNGSIIWNVNVGGGFTEALAIAGDVSGDGVADIITGGTDDTVRMRSGANGTNRWSVVFARPIRDVLALPDVDDDATTDVVAITAGGILACISGAGTASRTPLWTASLTDVGRMLATTGDIDGDGKPDVIACAESGQVSAFSGADGTLLWEWDAGDVVRAIKVVPSNALSEKPRIAAAVLDGTAALLPSEIPSGAGGGAATTVVHASKSKLKAKAPAIKRTFTGTNATEIPILLYHDIIPDIYYTYGCSVANFTAQMDVLVEGGFTAVTLDEVADWIEGTITLPEKSVCITFDGPYEGHETWALPILTERGLIANSYITTDWIGTANHCDWHQLRKQENSGIILIENHSINHPPLATVPADEVRLQITRCNDAITSHLGGKIATHHAYPNGSYNQAVINILDELDMRTATTVEARRATRSDRLLALPRFGILKNTSLPTFKSWVGFEDKPLPQMPYEFAGTVGSGWSYMGFGDMDAAGRIWICDYNVGKVRVFEQDGTEVSFSPITTGLKQNNASIVIETPSGVAITPSGEALISIADYLGGTQYFGVFRYNASTGAPLTGIDLAYRPGDIDCDAAGLIYIVDKVIDKFHVYTPSFAEVPGSPIGPQTTDHIQRGISVLPNSSKVYVISETDSAVHVWEGSASPAGASYSQGYDLVTGLGPQSGGVDVMDDGTILVSNDGGNRVEFYDSSHSVLGQLSGGSPLTAQPRGCIFTPDGSTVWIICKTGFVQKWVRTSDVVGWVMY